MANQMLQFMKALQRTISSMENPVQTKAHFVHSGKLILICDIVKMPVLVHQNLWTITAINVNVRTSLSGCSFL